MYIYIYIHVYTYIHIYIYIYIYMNGLLRAKWYACFDVLLVHASGNNGRPTTIMRRDDVWQFPDQVIVV